MRPSCSWFLISLWRLVILEVAMDNPVLYTVINGSVNPTFSKFLNMRFLSARTTGTSIVVLVLFSSSYDLVILKFRNSPEKRMFASFNSLLKFLICMASIHLDWYLPLFRILDENW